MCIVIICYEACYVINFEINHSSLVKPSFYITKKSGQKYKYLKNGKCFEKAFFIILKGFSIVRNCLRPESGPVIATFIKDEECGNLMLNLLE